MDAVDGVIVGAGVVGLAVARALAQRGNEIVVLESADAVGTATSSRNSEVIHAGIYYPANSLMARFCVSGRRALYDYCRTRGIPHQRCGKLIVATSPAEVERLDAIRRHAEDNGVDDLEMLDGMAARALEPALACEAALLSPSTGIVDSHALMSALQGEAEAAGAAIALNAPFLSATREAGGFVVEVGGDAPIALRCRLLVNSAGLGATTVARAVDAMPPALIPQAYYAKGNYFSCNSRAPFTRLIYPVPEPGGLGVHLTLDLGGQARFGPDVEWIDAIDYTVDPARAERFYPAIRRYWPGLPDGALGPAYAGIRPKIVPPAVAVQDFVVQDAQVHGVTGLVNLFGIESPGLTASLAIAEHVAALVAPLPDRTAKATQSPHSAATAGQAER